MGLSKEDSKLRMALYDGFDREMSLAEKSFARGNYLGALEHREKANRIYTSLKNTRL
jgi:flagellin-specific chaperone FliS